MIARGDPRQCRVTEQAEHIWGRVSHVTRTKQFIISICQRSASQPAYHVTGVWHFVFSFAYTRVKLFHRLWQ